MNTKDFYQFYDLYDLDILKIYIDENNHLNILLSMPIHMDYIANGLRSDFDYTKTHLFTFNEVQCNKPLNINNNKNIKISSYTLTSDSWIKLIINNIEILFR